MLWATKLNAWNGKNSHKFSKGCNKLFSLFNIYIRLTADGVEHLDDVLATVFSYLKFSQHTQLNPFILRELGAALKNVHRFAREPDATDNV